MSDGNGLPLSDPSVCLPHITQNCLLGKRVTSSIEELLYTRKISVQALFNKNIDIHDIVYIYAQTSTYIINILRRCLIVEIGRHSRTIVKYNYR